MKILVCSDRDGTINADTNNYLGSQIDWKEKVEFLPGVIEGIKKLNKQDIPLYIITNQPGVALKGFDKGNSLNFDLLTEKKAQEVNEFIIAKAFEKGVKIKGYEMCPFVDLRYVEKSKTRGRQINVGYLFDNHPDLKPNSGMIFKCAKREGLKLGEQYRLFVIGDRMSDIEAGLNANAELSILVSNKDKYEKEDLEEVKELQKKKPGKICIASNFLEAVDKILELIN